jgi:peptide/nickel transport system permease protein
VGGSAVSERIIGGPGMGLLVFDAIGARDYPTVMGASTVMALVTLASMLLVDLAYGVIDPRIRVDR